MPNQAKDFIPIHWKKWFALLRGISEGDITPADEAWYEIESDIRGLKYAIINLKEEGIHSISGLPLDLYKLDNPSMVLSELDMAAKRIHNEYEKAVSKLKQFSISIQEDFDAIDKECSVICKLIELYYSKVSVNQKNGCYYDEDGLFSDQYFDYDRIKDVYETATGYCFSPIPFDNGYYNCFYNLINLNIDLYAIETGLITDRIVPIKGREMSFYTFLIVLMLGRNVRRDYITYISNGIDDEFVIKIWWAEQFTIVIDRDKNAWIENYIREDWNLDSDGDLCFSLLEPIKAKDITDEDKRELKDFLNRETFESIFSFDELVSHEFEAYPYDEIGILSSLATIKNDRIAKLNRLSGLLTKEKNYYLETREWNCDCFVSEDSAKEIFARNRERRVRNIESNDLLKEKELLLDRIFCGEKVKDNALAIIDYLYTHSCFVNLTDKPIVTKSMIEAIVDSCINNNRKTLQLIQEEIDNASYYDAPTNKPLTKRQKKIIVKCKEALQDLGYIDADCVCSISNGQLARFLVEEGHVRGAKFKGEFWRDCKSPDQIENDEINKINQKLGWNLFDGVFKDKGGAVISAKKISKAFIDCDKDGSKVRQIIFDLYKKEQDKQDKQDKL